MAWTEITRPMYRRDGLRYASNTTDEEWALIEPLLPAPSERGRPRETAMRKVVNAIFYIAQSGCHWRMLPRDFPPFTTVQYYFYRWRDDGTWCRVNHALVMRTRELEGREASPSAGIIDSQSVKTTEAAGPRGYDAGKKINGRKRHLLVDSIGLMVAAIVHRADIQDRDGAPLLLATMRSAFPWLCGTSLPMPATPERSCARHWPSWGSGPSTSSGDLRRPSASSHCHGAGWWSAPSPGSIETGASQRTSKQRSKAHRLGSSSPASSCSRAASPGSLPQPSNYESDS